MDNAALAWALALWKDWLSNDFSEIRQLWYPAQSMVLECRGSVTESTADDTDNAIEHRVAMCVQNAVQNLTAAQRGALERSLGLCVVVRVRDYEQQLEDAHGRVWRALLSQGVV
jgi:hypothetical protein